MQARENPATQLAGFPCYTFPHLWMGRSQMHEQRRNFVGAGLVLGAALLARNRSALGAAATARLDPIPPLPAHRRPASRATSISSPASGAFIIASPKGPDEWLEFEGEATVHAHSRRRRLRRRAAHSGAQVQRPGPAAARCREAGLGGSLGQREQRRDDCAGRDRQLRERRRHLRLGRRRRRQAGEVGRRVGPDHAEVAAAGVRQSRAMAARPGSRPGS